MLKRVILHPFALAIFPILALLAHNITEVTPRVALRSAIITLLATVILILIFALISRNWQKSAIITTIFLVLFFSYGQVYEFLQAHPVFNFSFGRHRYLVVIFSTLFIAGFWLTMRKIRIPANTTMVLNIIGILLLVFPLYQIISYIYQTGLSERRLAEFSKNTDTLTPVNPDSLPDVYFIVLDGYTRGDALLDDFGFDNSEFLDNLRSMGFFVVDCSRANTTTTHGSISIALNMAYLPELSGNLDVQELQGEDFAVLIKQSRVRKLLTSIGYKTIAFESGYEWSRLRDADVYLQYTGAPYEMQVLQPFESLLIRSTALLLWSDSTYRSLPEYTKTPFAKTNFPFEDHINRQLFIFDQLPRLASFPGPKFVFVHVLIPHIPYVFEPDGEIATDTLYYSGRLTGPADGEHQIKGYTNEIQFLNSQMSEILRTLITQSANPPIIVMIGDHGVKRENRLENLAAYYLPGEGKQSFYPTMTPVNAFRVIFDTTFGTNYGLLPDISYNESLKPAPETSPTCLK